MLDTAMNWHNNLISQKWHLQLMFTCLWVALCPIGVLVCHRPGYAEANLDMIEQLHHLSEISQPCWITTDFSSWQDWRQRLCNSSLAEARNNTMTFNGSAVSWLRRGKKVSHQNRRGTTSRPWFLTTIVVLSVPCWLTVDSFHIFTSYSSTLEVEQWVDRGS